jgi:hypothetical protein
MSTLEVTMTWFWMNIPPAVLFFLAWTLIPLWMVVRHPDTGPGIPAREAPPANRAAATTAGPTPVSRPSTSAVPAHLPDSPRKEALAGHH